MHQVLVESDPSPMKLEVLGVDDWPLLVHETGIFEQQATVTETSLILEGEATIKPVGGEPISVAEGDLLTIMPETRCVWTITKAIHRHCDCPDPSLTKV